MLAAIFPAPHRLVEWEKTFDSLGFDLLRGSLLVPRPGASGVPPPFRGVSCQRRVRMSLTMPCDLRCAQLGPHRAIHSSALSLTGLL